MVEVSFNFEDIEDRLDEKARDVVFYVKGYREVDLSGIKKGVFDLVVLGGKHDGKLFSQWFDQKSIFLAKKIFTACGLKSIKELGIEAVVGSKFMCDVDLYISSSGKQYYQIVNHREFVEEGVDL